jgi:hypothetical protein
MPIFVDEHGRELSPNDPTHPYKQTVVTPEMMRRAEAERQRRIKAALAERQEMEARIAKEREKKAAEEARARLEAYEESKLAAWVAAGGTRGEFYSDPNGWKRMKGEYLAGATAQSPREAKIQAAYEKMKAARLAGVE